MKSLKNRVLSDEKKTGDLDKAAVSCCADIKYVDVVQTRLKNEWLSGNDFQIIGSFLPKSKMTFDDAPTVMKIVTDHYGEFQLIGLQFFDSENLAQRLVIQDHNDDVYEVIVEPVVLMDAQ